MVKIIQQFFDPYVALQEFQGSLALSQSGANSIFIGNMRDFNESDQVTAMFLEYYPGMTEKVLDEICSQAVSQWDINQSLLIHRVGDINPGETIVLVSVWSAHRAESFAACRYIIEALKSEAPFWKKETLKNSERWVQKNT